MTTEQALQEEHPGIKPEMQAEWKKFVENAIGLEPGVPREGAIKLLKQVSLLLQDLSLGRTMEQVIADVEPATKWAVMSLILQLTITYSTRGEELRLWWNAWNNRTHPDDVKAPTDREPVRLIFLPWEVTYNGKRLTLDGTFDPAVPLTKHPQYLELVNAAIQAKRAAAAAI